MSSCCPICNKQIIGKSIFCSKKCSNMSRRRNIAIIKCRYCLSEVEVEQKDRKRRFCSEACKMAAKEQRRKPKLYMVKYHYKFSEEEFKSLSSIDKAKYGQFTCPQCTNVYYVYTSLLKKYKYCSHECRNKSLTPKPEVVLKRLRYSEAIHKCSYDQFKYLSYLFTHLKTRCVEYNRIYDISILDLIEILQKQRGRCALSGRLFTYASNYKDLNTVSIDRIDSSKDYTKDNIQLVIDIINKAKNVLSNSEFISLCKEVCESNKTK